jgi:hypothetical protein
MIQLGEKYCTIFSAFMVPMKLVGLIQMCLNETYSKVCIGKHLSDSFPIQNGLNQRDAQSPLLFNFSLDHAIRKVKANQVRLQHWLSIDYTTLYPKRQNY